MILSLIAALDRHRAIGKGNDLPWRLPDDLKRFKALTLGKPVLMGRKTAESLGRALPGRTNLVLTRSDAIPFEGMRVVHSVEAAIEVARSEGAEELCVIGGGEIYALMLPIADRLHLTHVDANVIDAEAFFPAFDASQWDVASRQRHRSDEKHVHAFEFVDYIRKE